MKKRIKIILSIILIIVVLVGAGTLLAYLTDTDEKTNVFTVGRIKIELEEANWDQSLATNLKPGDTLDKDPKINNIGKNSAYVYIKVINPIVELMNNTEGPLFNYTINQGWTQLSTMDDCNYRITTYYYNTALNANASTTALFDEVTLANFGSSVETIQDMNIYAYGIQSRNVGTNIPTIFSSHFSNNLSDTTLTCPGMVPEYNGEGCANITDDSSGGGGNATMSGLTLMMKNASLGTDENIDFSLPAANWTDNNFSGSSTTGGPTNTTTYYYTYADSYTFNTKTGKYTLTNPSVGKYPNVYSSLVGKYLVSTSGSTSSTPAASTNVDKIYKVTAANSEYTYLISSHITYSRTMTTSYQERFFTYADSYTFDPTTGKFSLVNPSVGKYSDIYTILPGKYVVSITGSTSSTPANSTNISTISKVFDLTTLTTIEYSSSTVSPPITYIISSTTQVAGDNGQGVYTRDGTENDKYPIYYYRGTQALSNNIVFGGFCWKIIRTTATGGIRMIYNGVKNSDNSCGTAAGNNTERTYSQNQIKMTRGALNGDNYTYTTGTSTSTFPYNVQSAGHKYVGYMYETTEENDTDSNLKRVLDAWYSVNLTSYDSKIEDSIYCNDRTYTTSGSYQYYCPRTRGQNGTPTTLCTRTTDAFGVNSGNKKSTYKVGFITIDEEMLAGRSWTYGMKDYLYNNTYYWTGSPNSSSTSSASVFYVYYAYGLGDSSYVNNTFGVRPVVSLKANTSYTGTGTLTDPFIVN